MHTPPAQHQVLETSEAPPSPGARNTDRKAVSMPPLEPLPPRCVPSQELLGTHKTLAIAHEGVVYHLRTTRLGKLILTK